MLESVSTTSLATGFTLSASLIVAIGAQNAFVLRQGLRREHVAAVVAVCAALDVALMAVGISGLGAVLQERPALLQAATWGGVLVLAWYGLAALRRAFSPHTLHAEQAGAKQALRAVVLQALGISLLNPHVYLDTVLLVGSVGARQPPGTQGAFLAGAGLASSLWFALLGFGARVLSPVFEKPVAWRVLDVAVAASLWWIAVQLAFWQPG